MWKRWYYQSNIFNQRPTKYSTNTPTTKSSTKLSQSSNVVFLYQDCYATFSIPNWYFFGKLQAIKSDNLCECFNIINQTFLIKGPQSTRPTHPQPNQVQNNLNHPTPDSNIRIVIRPFQNQIENSLGCYSRLKVVTCVNALILSTNYFLTSIKGSSYFYNHNILVSTFKSDDS